MWMELASTKVAGQALFVFLHTFYFDHGPGYMHTAEVKQ